MPSVDMSANLRPASLHIGKWSIGMPTRRSGSSTPSAASAACASGHMARLVPATGKLGPLLVQRHVEALGVESRGEREPGDAAADDADGVHA